MSADNVAAAPVVDVPADQAAAADAPAAEPQVQYKLVTSDGENFRMCEKALNMSNTLKDCAGALGYTAENVDEMDAIPINNVTGPCFAQVLSFCNHHMNDPAPAANDEPRDVVISEWDAEFLKMEGEELFHLICAANFLDIKPLLDVSCKTVANMIKGKTPEEMRVIFMIPTDEEDEAAEKAAEAERAAAAAAN